MVPIVLLGLLIGCNDRSKIVADLKAQDDLLAKQRTEEVKANEQKSKAERAAKQAELAKFVSVALVSKNDKVQDDDQRVAVLELVYDSKTDKNIKAVKGVLKIVDIYGAAIVDVILDYRGGITARQSAVKFDTTVPINRSIDAQVNLWDTDFDKLKSTFEINSIDFGDGTSMNVPD
jgi:hypothetical protein